MVLYLLLLYFFANVILVVEGQTHNPTTPVPPIFCVHLYGAKPTIYCTLVRLFSWQFLPDAL
jgi:hypothetical protein